MNNENKPSGEYIRIQRGKIDSLIIHEVKDHELDILENGENTDLFFSYSVFLLSTAVSCITALGTATFTNSIIQNAFLFTSIIGVILGVFLLNLWWKGRRNKLSVIAVIRKRMNESYTDYKELTIPLKIDNTESTDITTPK